MGFFSSLWGKNSENGKNTQNNTPTVQQPGVSDRSGTPADAGRNDGIASRKEIPARLCGGCLGNGVSGQQDRTGKAAGRL